MREISYVEALNEALKEEMERDETVFMMGQDVGKFGGIFGVTKGLYERFGPERVKDTPLSETAIIGAAVGAAAAGQMRPVCELMLADFVGVCIDEIYNKAGKWKYMHGGAPNISLVIRAPMGAKGGGGAEHSQCPEALFMHGPGLKMLVPSTPYDAKGLLKSAIRDDDPVLFFEHKLLYNTKGEVPAEEYVAPIGKAATRREGRDVTILAYSLMVHKALEAAALLEAEGISAEVIDLRSLIPLDEETILDSVAKTGRAVIVHEANKRGGVGAEISALIAEKGFQD
ncbi:MAG: pyruvate dehydrogenase complex E1 component subunit beta, partial [Bacillota bacterium]